MENKRFYLRESSPGCFMITMVELVMVSEDGLLSTIRYEGGGHDVVSSNLLFQTPACAIGVIDEAYAKHGQVSIALLGLGYQS